MDMQWTQLRVTGAVENLETISAVMSMVNNSLMIEDYSDVTTDGMYGALLDESLLHADKTRAAVSVFIPETQSVAEGKAFIETHLAAAGIPYEMEVVGCREEDWAGVEEVLSPHQGRQDCDCPRVGGIHARPGRSHGHDGPRHGVRHGYA